MSTVLLLGAVLVAVSAAARSTWSPCGLSMLSTITPMTERARGHRFGVTSVWFLVGALTGGAMLGAVGAAGALALDAADLPVRTAIVAAAVLSILAGAVDAGSLGIRPPFFRRQVDDAWLRQYRPWVYGVGFGWQIGVGVTTYVMTAGVVLTVFLAALTASPLAAVVLGVLFGGVRGSAVYLAAGATDPAGLRRLHTRMAGMEAPVRVATMLSMLLVGLLLAATAGGVAGTGLALGSVAGVWALARHHRPVDARAGSAVEPEPVRGRRRPSRAWARPADGDRSDRGFALFSLSARPSRRSQL